MNLQQRLIGIVLPEEYKPVSFGKTNSRFLCGLFSDLLCPFLFLLFLFCFLSLFHFLQRFAEGITGLFPIFSKISLVLEIRILT